MSSVTKSVTLLKLFNLFKNCDLKNNSIISSTQRITWIPRNIRYFSSVTIQKESERQPIIPKKDLLQLDRAFPEIVEYLTKNEIFGNLTEVTSRFERSLKYNVPNGKKNRGLAVLKSYKILEKPEKLSDENLRLATILGWSIEMLQAFLLVLDDLTDGSETRRGQLCWYKHGDIGLTGINDGLLLQNGVYMLLRKYFSHHPSYVKFLEIFQHITLLTTVGQILDSNIVHVANMSMKRYEHIACYKTSYYSFYLPVALALYLSNHTNPETHEGVRRILLEIGNFFQIQDDFLDCFGDPKVTGKIGTDIETGKCTWLAVTAMQLSSDNQKKLMEENYGKKDPQNVARIKNLYLELEIPKLFTKFEEESYKQIKSSIQNRPKDIPEELFNKFVETIYKRVS